jgi:hypothetical protein
MHPWYRYDTMALTMGFNPADNITVPFTPDNITFMDALQEKILNPLQDEGELACRATTLET